MQAFDYDDAPYQIREDLGAAHRHYWDTLRRSGSWWTGAQRIAIARESRNALTCEFCAQRKTALSPYGGETQHQHDGGLPELAIDAVHRIITDQTRITRAYVEDNDRNGLSKAAYVELVGVVVAVFSIDEFHRALGLPLEPLPEALTGEPTHYMPTHLSEDIGFVPTVSPDGDQGPEADLWNDSRAANVVRALTLVPDAMRAWRDLAGAQYLSFAGMANFVKDENRAIDRMQMELVAGRVSSINECFY